jgi:PPOX class probable F420-dependent enzyme
VTGERAWALLGAARVARMATLAAHDGRPALVPITFAVAGGVVYHAVDHKPKSTRALARLANLEADPRACVLADHYDDADWDALWWVRADGTARILDADSPHAAHALDVLAEKYAQYRAHRPAGPVIALEVDRITGWEAARRNRPRAPTALAPGEETSERGRP